MVSKDQSGNATTGANGVPGTEQPGYHGWSATTPVVMSAKDNTSSSTRSGISGGEITISNEADQQALTGQTAAEAIASLNRDVSSDRDGTNAIDNLYERDKEKIDAGFEITRAFQYEVSTFAVNKAREADELKKALEAQGIDPESNAEYQNALKWAPGGQYSQIITAISAATGSNVMGGFDQLAQAAVLNYVQGMTAQQIKKLADSIGEGTVGSEAARAVLQGLAACGAQASQGGNCASAGLGTAAGVIANAVLNHLDKKPDEMSSEEKKAREDLITTLIAGAAASAGGDVGSAVASSQVEVENNSLNLAVQVGKMTAQGCMKMSACRDRLIASGLGALLGIEASTSAMDALSDSEKMNLIYLASLNDPSQLSNLNDAQRAAYESLTGKMLPNPGPTNTGGDQIADSGPTNTGNNSGPIDPGSNHTGNNNGQVDTGPNHTGGNQTVDQLPNKTGNQSGTPDVGGTVYESSKLQEKADALIRGEDIRVGSVEEARAILDKIPTLRPGPGGDLMPGMLDRGNTYRGDLINVNDPLSPNIHDQGKHADQPHYNIDIRSIDANGTEIKKKPAIFIDN